MTHKGWRVIKPRHNQKPMKYWVYYLAWHFLSITNFIVVNDALRVTRLTVEMLFTETFSPVQREEYLWWYFRITFVPKHILWVLSGTPLVVPVSSYKVGFCAKITTISSEYSITITCLFKYTENFTTKKWTFSDKKILTFFILLLKNIDCVYSLEPPQWGGSNKYPQSMFLSRNKKKNVYPCTPQFYCIKVGLRVSTLYRHVFMMLLVLDYCRTC